MHHTIPDIESLHAPYADLLQAALTAASPAGAQLAIDLGCGPGLKAGWLAERLAPGGLLVGIDIDRLAVAQAADRHRAEWLAADAHALPLRESCADLCWCVAALDLFAAPRAALTQARRALRPGGTLVIAAATQLWARPRSWPEPLYTAWADRRPPPPADDLGDGLTGALADAGFSDTMLWAYMLDRPGRGLARAALPLASWESLAPVVQASLTPDARAACAEAEEIAEPDPLPLLLIAVGRAP